MINKEMENKRTILIDAGNGNNLGYLYLNLVKKSIKNGFDINKVLDNIIIAREFTFYQLANIIIKELPKLIDEQVVDCKIQIIVMDLLDTSLPSSSSFGYNKIRAKGNGYNLITDFDTNVNLLTETIDNLIGFRKSITIL